MVLAFRGDMQMLKIIGSIPMAHVMDYSAIEEAVEAYVERAAKDML